MRARGEHLRAQSAVPATKSAFRGSQSAAPATKSAHRGSQSAVPQKSLACQKVDFVRHHNESAVARNTRRAHADFVILRSRNARQ